MGFDMAKVECYNYHRKGYFARECRSPKDSRRTALLSHKEEVYQLRPQLLMHWSLTEEEPTNFALMAFSSSSSNSSSDCETGLESVEARLLVYKQNESALEENIKLLNIEVQLRDTTLATLRQKLETTEKDRDDLNIKLEKFQTSSKRGYHAVPPPMTGTFMPPKLDLVFHTPPSDKNEHLAFNEEDIPQVTKDVPSLAQSLELVKTPRKPFIRHTSPKPSISPPRVNAANPSAVSTARVNAAKLSAVSAARINAVKPSVVTAVQHNHTKKVWRPKTLVLDHAFRTISASMTLKCFDYNDAFGRSKSVMAWVPKRN
nr:hypothetical protein [Tanacetum cinerariifolium]